MDFGIAFVYGRFVMFMNEILLLEGNQVSNASEGKGGIRQLGQRRNFVQTEGETED